MSAAPSEPRVVLVVDDEPGLREVIRECLEAAGYVVIEAGDGQEAIETFEHRGGAVDLLLTDTHMPGMSGRELAERLQALQPALGVIMMSGYPDDAVVLHPVLSKGVVFLQKPFTLDALAHSLREVLDRRHPRT